jgi:PQQ-dependent dehydrogenase (methanol/ethanol family)
MASGYPLRAIGLWTLALASGLAAGVALAGQGIDTDALLRSPNQEWLSYGGDYAETHYSPLDQIDQSNVDRLGRVWEWAIPGTAGSLEATPLVAGGVIYGSGTWSHVFALDAATGALLWRWDPAIVRSRQDGGPSMCCGPVNRGLAIYGDKVFAGLLDGRLVALNKDTGEIEWVVQTTPVGGDYAITGAPRVVKGNVIIGNAGAEFGVRGFVTAYDAETGEQVWRFYTVPGNPADGFENEAMRAAAETWSGQWWFMGGGGTAWDGFAFDPEEDLLYVGVGNGSPWNQSLRSPEGGDNLYLSSIVALNPDNGELVWYYQVTPGDTWDYTATQPMMLLDVAMDGRERKIIVQAPKNGFFYVLDRVTGAFISAEPFSDDITWASGVDPETGRPIENPEARYDRTGQGMWVSPGPGGAHNWQPMSFNPMTGLVYFQAGSSRYWYNDVRNLREFVYTPGQYNEGVTTSRGGEPRPPAPPLEGGSVLLAWDPVENREVWRIDREGSSGTLSIAGNLLFRGGNGQFHAHDPANGDVLWSAFIGGGNMATPVSYDVGGRQFIAVELSGGGGGGRGGRGGPEFPARVVAFALDPAPLPRSEP